MSVPADNGRNAVEIRNKRLDVAQVQRNHAVCKASYHAWADGLGKWLSAERGRYSRLAEHLGVNRQTVWRWFAPGAYSNVPAWAGIHANIWHAEEIKRQLVSPQADNLLSPQTQRLLDLSADPRTKQIGL